MGKWAFWAAAVFFSCSLTLTAQTTRQVDLLGLDQSRMVGNLSALNSAHYGFPWLTLGDARLFSLSSGYDWIEPAPFDFLPDVSTEAEMPRAISSAKVRHDSSDKIVEKKSKFFDYTGGEVGVLYGHSVGGKFSRELEQGYIFGEMGNDKTRISVGASYERSSGRRR